MEQRRDNKILAKVKRHREENAKKAPNIFGIPITNKRASIIKLDIPWHGDDEE
jgi:hypothetical protein